MKLPVLVSVSMYSGRESLSVCASTLENLCVCVTEIERLFSLTMSLLTCLERKLLVLLLLLLIFFKLFQMVCI